MQTLIKKNQMFCAVFQNNFTIQYFTTIHTSEKFDEKFYKNSVKRKSISSKNIHFENFLFSKFIRQYNKHINDIDSNAQMKIAYFFNVIKNRKFWWKSWINILMTSVIKFFLLYKLLNLKFIMKHINFQRIVAIKLFENSVDRRNSFVSLKKTFIYTFDYMIMYTNEMLNEFNHHIRKINEKKYCEFCRQNRISFSKRKTLTEINFNDQKIKRTRSRFFQISFVCSKCETAICNIETCWNKLHRMSDSENEKNEKT